MNKKIVSGFVMGFSLISNMTLANSDRVTGLDKFGVSDYLTTADLVSLGTVDKASVQALKGPIKKRTVDLALVEREIEAHAPQYLALASMYTALYAGNTSKPHERDEKAAFEEKRINEAALALARMFRAKLKSSQASESAQTRLLKVTGEVNQEIQALDIPQYKPYNIARAVIDRNHVETLKKSVVNGLVCATVSFLSGEVQAPAQSAPHATMLSKAKDFATRWASKIALEAIQDNPWEGLTEEALASARGTNPREAFVDVMYDMAAKAVYQHGPEVKSQLFDYLTKGSYLKYDMIVNEIDQLMKTNEPQDRILEKHRSPFSDATGTVAITLTGNNPVNHKVFSKLKIVCESVEQADLIRREGVSSLEQIRRMSERASVGVQSGSPRSSSRAE